LEGLVLGPPDLIDRLSKMLGDVELVMHQLGVRKMMRHRVRIGRKHVGGDRPNFLPLLDRQRLEDGLGSRLGAFRNHVKNAGTIDISEDGDVVMPLPEALLVNAQVGDVRRFPTLQAPCDCAIHDGLHGIPGEAEQGGRGIHGAAGLQDFDGKGFEEEGESGVLACPWRHDRLHAVLRTSASWESGDQLRRELHGVEVPPAPLVGVIGKTAGNATFRARDARTEVREPNLDSPLFEPKVNRVNPPRVIDPEQSSIMRRECFHPGTLRHRSLRNDRPVPRKSPKNHEMQWLDWLALRYRRFAQSDGTPRPRSEAS
jgi:hypothetical protein